MEGLFIYTAVYVFLYHQSCVIEHVMHRLSDVGCVAIVVVKVAMLAISGFRLVEKRFERARRNLMMK